LQTRLDAPYILIVLKKLYHQCFAVGLFGFCRTQFAKYPQPGIAIGAAVAYFCPNYSSMARTIKLAFLVTVCTFCFGTAFAQMTATEWFNKGMRLFDEKKYGDAVVAFDKAGSLDAKMDKAFYRAGWCYNDLEDYNKAVERLQKAVAIKANYAEAHQEMGYAYKKLGKRQEALASLDKAIAARPTYALAYKQRGDVYQDMGNKDEAIKAYLKCIEYDAKNEPACYNLGYMYNAKEDYTNALLWLRKANAITEKTTTYNEIGFAFYKQKLNDSSIAAYRNALRLTPTNGTAYKGIGDVYRRNYKPAKTDEAMESYKKAIEYNPKSAGSHFGLGWCYNEKGRYNEAVPVLSKSLELDNALVAGYTELGYAQYMTGKNSEALTTFKKGISLDGKNTLCRYYSGLVYIVLKDKANATVMYNQLQSLDQTLASKLQAKINAL
jgi:tetratricopeptide (TPR) repeat protein